LDRYHNSEPLHDEYKQCNKKDLILDFKNAKEVKESAPARVPNIFVTKNVYAKVGNITAGVGPYYFLEHISYPTPVRGT